METTLIAIRTYLAKLGLEAEIADLYYALHTYGPQTISELSRSSHVERTRIYRLIDQLMESGLLEVETQHKRAILKPAPVANLRILIEKRAEELRSLQDELQMVEQVLARNSISTAGVRAQTYQGDTGLQQILWNITKARSAVLGTMQTDMHMPADKAFYIGWVAAINDTKLHFDWLTDGAATSTTWLNGSCGAVPENWNIQTIHGTPLPLTHSMVIYDDVVAYFLSQHGQVYGLEVINKAIATQQRHVWQLILAQASSASDSAKA